MQHRAGELCVVAGHADDDGDGARRTAARGDADAFGDGIAGLHAAAVHVDQDRPHRRVVEDQLEAAGDVEAGRGGADVHEVGRPAASVAYQVEGRECQPGAVDEDADVPVHADVVDLVLLGLQL